jgi:hypothetical protein
LLSANGHLLPNTVPAIPLIEQMQSAAARTICITAGHRPDLRPVRYFLVVFLISVFFLGRILWPFWSILDPVFSAHQPVQAGVYSFLGRSSLPDYDGVDHSPAC